MEHSCVVTKLEAIEREGEIERKINFNWSTGAQISEDKIIFGDESQEINFLVTSGTEMITIQCDCIPISKKYNVLINDIKKKINQQGADALQFQTEVKTLQSEVNAVKRENMVLVEAYEKKNVDVSQYQAEAEKMRSEIGEINRKYVTDLDKVQKENAAISASYEEKISCIMSEKERIEAEKEKIEREKEKLNDEYQLLLEEKYREKEALEKDIEELKSHWTYKIYSRLQHRDGGRE